MSVETIPKAENSSLIVTRGDNETSVELIYDKIDDPSKEAREWGVALHQAGLATTPGGGSFVAMVCFTERMSFAEFARRYYPYGGQLTMRAGYAYADFLHQGGKVDFIQMDNEGCIGKWSFGQFSQVEIGFTIQEAEKIGLTKKDTWKSYPSDMLFARAVMRSLRRIAPHIVAGVYEQDEIESAPKAKSARQKASPKPKDEPKDVAAAGEVSGIPENYPSGSSANSPPPATSSTTSNKPPTDPAPQFASIEQLKQIVELGTQVTNVDTGNPFTVQEIATTIQKAHNCRPEELPSEKAAKFIEQLEKFIAKKQQAA